MLSRHPPDGCHLPSIIQVQSEGSADHPRFHSAFLPHRCQARSALFSRKREFCLLDFVSRLTESRAVKRSSLDREQFRFSCCTIPGSLTWYVAMTQRISGPQFYPYSDRFSRETCDVSNADRTSNMRQRHGRTGFKHEA
jgi:hypothetical protein